MPTPAPRPEPDVAVVTGCSTGIGFATALRLAREGCRVHATVRSEASGAALVDAAAGLALSLLVLDVDDDTSVAQGIGRVLADEGRVDILVNNAGVMASGDIEGMPLATFVSMMNTNTWGMLRCIQAVLPSMRERRHGTIVNVTSIAGRVACPGQGAYAASKWAAEAISEILAAEVAPFGVRVAVVEPGVVVTAMVDKAMQQPIDMESPYFPTTFRTTRFLLAGLAAPSSPDDVAAAVWESISTEQPTLRRAVGEDALALARERPAVPDDTWVTTMAGPDDEEWRSRMAVWGATEVPPL
jgi:NAD(P)-dependent dehydrogenase (short-subunit alcohol dehydrogenase family)